LIPYIDEEFEPPFALLVTADVVRAASDGVSGYASALVRAGMVVHFGWLAALELGLAAAIFAGVDYSEARKLGAGGVDARPVVAMTIGYPAAGE
jgi:hypothetical protein